MQNNSVCVTIKYYGIKNLLFIMLGNLFFIVYACHVFSLCHEIDKFYFSFITLITSSLYEKKRACALFWRYQKMLRTHNFRPDRANFENLQAKFKQKKQQNKTFTSLSCCFRARAAKWKKEISIITADRASGRERQRQRWAQHNDEQKTINKFAQNKTREKMGAPALSTFYH